MPKYTQKFGKLKLPLDVLNELCPDPIFHATDKGLNSCSIVENNKIPNVSVKQSVSLLNPNHVQNDKSLTGRTFVSTIYYHDYENNAKNSLFNLPQNKYFSNDVRHYGEGHVPTLSEQLHIPIKECKHAFKSYLSMDNNKDDAYDLCLFNSSDLSFPKCLKSSLNADLPTIKADLVSDSDNYLHSPKGQHGNMSSDLDKCVSVVKCLPFECDSVGNSRWLLLSLNNVLLPFLLDTGSQISLLKESLQEVYLTSTDICAKSASGNSLKISGKAEVSITIDEVKYLHTMYVCESLSHNILGMDFLESHKCKVDLVGCQLFLDDLIVPLHTKDELRCIGYEINGIETYSVTVRTVQALPHEITAQIQALPTDQRQPALALVNHFCSLFDDSVLGCAVNYEHVIELFDTKPVKQMPRRVSQVQRDIIHREVSEMLKNGIIEHSHSPWATPIVLVKKKDNGVRFCVDYRRLNLQTKVDGFPLPNPQDIFDSLTGSKFFATLDLKSGFWQIPVREGDRYKTAFCIPGGHFQFIRMPFGLVNATATFQRVMEDILNNMIGEGVHVFVDDVVVYAESFNQLLERLEQVFKRIQNVGMSLNSKKCHLFKTEIDLLGYHVSESGLSPNKDKVSSILSWPEPLNRKDIRSFLGTASYYRRFIKDFAEIANPLTCLTSIKCKWSWGLKEANAFASLKESLTSAPVLSLFTQGRQIVIDTDASAYAVGAVLAQIDSEGEEHVVAYYSRCLSGPEKNYCVTRRELLAVLDSLRHWRHYVSGVDITVRSDHASLTWLRSFKQPEGQLARWLERMAEFNVTLLYRKGSASSNADGLSRRPCIGDCSHCLKKEFKESEVTVNSMLVDELNWEVEQSKDIDLMKLKDWLIQGAKPPWEEVSAEHYVLKTLWTQYEIMKLSDNVITRIFFLPFEIKIDQIVVPQHLKTELTTKSHILGHFGIQRTQNSVSQRYYWPGWKKDVISVVSSCNECNKRKGPHKRAKLPLKRYQASEPMQRIAVDVLGPLPKTIRENKYIVVVTDYFSKWVEAIAVPNQEATTIADVLINSIITRFGVPNEIHSDQGKNFESKLIQLICERLSINKTRTTPYRPQSDGQTERFNRTLLDALAKLSDAQKDWDLLVPLVCLYYRATVHASTGVSPALLMLGRELRLPVDIIFPPLSTSKSETYPEYVVNLERKLFLASEYARAHLRLTWDQMSTAHPVSKKLSQLDISKPVLLFNPSVPKGTSPKLACLWRGPFQILQQLSPYLYRIKVGGRRGSQVVHRYHIFQPRMTE